MITGSFSLKQLKVATENFDPLNKIGEGGFGSVYKVQSVFKFKKYQISPRCWWPSGSTNHPWYTEIYSLNRNI